jgi:hypothetical protein
MMIDERKEFKVRIMYREPNFEDRNGPKEEPYVGIYNVTAVDEAAAIALAIEEFHLTAKLSSVGWVRKIVSAEVAE